MVGRGRQAGRGGGVGGVEVPMGAFARPPLRKKSFVLVPWLCFSNFLCGVSNNPRVAGNFLSFAFISGYENFYDR